MRDQRREEGSLNENIVHESGMVTERACTISQDEADMRIGKRDRTAEELEQLRLDASIVLSGLPEKLRQIAMLLLTESKVNAAKKLGIPRTTLNDAAKRIRTKFEDAGLGDYL